MKAFIGRSFDEKDEVLVNKIVELIKSHDIECVDAKPARSKKVDEKIVDLIKECEIFVGIFTRDKTICQEEKETKWICKPRIKTTMYTTSNWVIQESGFALGKDKELILLKENGVCELPKLQGNFEYITFGQSSLEETFLKINQMISDIKGKTVGGVTEKSSGELKSPDETKPEEQESQPKEEIQDEKQKVLDKIYNAIWGDKNYSEAQRIFNDEAEELLDEDDKVLYLAIILRESHSLGDKSAFEKLQKIARENADNPLVIKQLAHRYKDMREFNKAKEYFLLAAGTYVVSDADKKSGLVDAYVQAAWCLADDDDLNGALAMLKKLILDPNFQDSKAKIFKEMSKISKDKDDTERFYVYAEAALDIDPSDTDLRFKLAFSYNQNEYVKLSLIHYKILTDTTVNSMALNNLGAQYGELKLQGKCVNSYCKAAGYNETLAMANLARKYLNEGFTKDAQELVDRANKLSNEGIKVDYRVGDAQKRIKDLTEEENKKEKEILLEAEKERKFYVCYAKAFCSEETIAKEEIEGNWETPWGNGQLTFNEEANSFEIDISIEKKDLLASLPSYFAGDQGKVEDVYKTEHHKIKGRVNNLSGKYTIDAKETGTTIMTKGVEYAATGYMVIDEGSNSIDVMEKTKDGKNEFKQWKKLKN